jgi:cytolysin (calcineurin-like family phosphatase)
MLVGRRDFIRLFGASAVALVAPRSLVQTIAQADVTATTDVTFVFISDVHACRMGVGLSPNCLKEGKTEGTCYATSRP